MFGDQSAARRAGPGKYPMIIIKQISSSNKCLTLNFIFKRLFSNGSLRMNSCSRMTMTQSVRLAVVAHFLLV